MHGTKKKITTLFQACIHGYTVFFSENECLNGHLVPLAGCTSNLNNQNLFFWSITLPPGGT